MRQQKLDVGNPLRFTALLALALLGGCGGGGGGGSSTPPPANLNSAPGGPALNAYYQSSHNNTLTGSLSGVTYTYTVNFTPNTGTTTFNGTSGVNSATQILTISGGGSSQSQTQTVYYTLSPFNPVGSIVSTGSPYSVESNFTPLPATVTVGQTGAFNTVTAYQGSALGAVEATEVNTYSVNADTPSTLQLCTLGTTTAVLGNADSLTSGTENDCYRVDASGNVSLYSITVSTPSGTITFK